ncbi:MAG: Rv2175c family DNA-binding protein [Mycobacteriales bacterium]|nr:DNA-binding protein [Frankia sp.]
MPTETELPSDDDGARDTGGATDDVWQLAGEWLTLADVGAALGTSAHGVRSLLRDGRLLALRRSTGAEMVPAAFVAEGAVVKGLPGTITVLRDAGYDDAAAVRWLFTPDDSLPGTPIAALRENRGREVKRRAQALAF